MECVDCVVGQYQSDEESNATFCSACPGAGASKGNAPRSDTQSMPGRARCTCKDNFFSKSRCLAY